MRLPYGVCIQLPLLMSMPCSSHFRPHRTQSCPNKKGLNRHFLLGCNVLVIHLSLMLTDNRRNTLSWWKKICSIHKSGHIYVAGLWCVPEISCCDQVLFLWWNFFLNPHIYFHKKNDKNVIYILRIEIVFDLGTLFMWNFFLFHIRKEATQAISVESCEMEQA